MKCSLIFTIYNEEKIIKELIDSILNQTRVPDEIVIVDSLSKDNTVKIIKSFKNKKIKLIEKKSDIGTGRNIAIKAAKHDIILVVDGGCILEKHWCEEMLKPFENPKIMAVGGVFKPVAKNIFERVQGMIICKPIKKIDPKKFLPSSRSLGFRKEVWKKVRGYPKHKIVGEDTLFNLLIKEKGYKFYINKKAFVLWRMRSPFKNFFRQYYLYAAGDVRIGNIYRMKKNLLFAILFPLYLLASIVLLFFSWPIGIILLAPTILYTFFWGIKAFFSTGSLRGLYWGIVISFSKRFAYAIGIWRELFSNHKRGYKNENYEKK